MFDIAGVFPVYQVLIQGRDTSRTITFGAAAQLADPGADQEGLAPEGGTNSSACSQARLTDLAQDIAARQWQGFSSCKLDRAQAHMRHMRQELNRIRAEVSALDHRQAVCHLTGLSSDALQLIVQAYLMAATAKDCSIMVSLQKAPMGWIIADCQPHADMSIIEWSQCSGSCLQHKESACQLRHRVSVIDLGAKPANKIPEHHALDIQIVQAALQAE